MSRPNAPSRSSDPSGLAAGESALRLPDRVREEISRACRDAFPREACGILLGTETPAGRWVSRSVAVRNDAPAELQTRRYCVPPDVLLRVEREASAQGVRVLGFYHSHPNHAPQPSPTDLAQAWPYYSYLIVSVRGGETAELRSWRLDEAAGRFQPEPLVVVSEAGRATDASC